MKPEIKQRIEQIKAGQVPDGYKRTKVGIVPIEWKESVVGDCVSEYVEKTTVENQYPILTSARTGLMFQSEYYSNNQVTTNDNVGYNVLPRGYVTYRSRSDDGRFRFNENQIIDKGIISYFYPVFSFNANVSHTFMLSLLNQTIYRQSYSFVEGTAQQVLSFKKLSSLKYCLPSLPEQEKIVEILSTQDRIIELQQKKIDELQKLKKVFLRKMFPQKGKKVPEWRFPQFTGDWEQIKLNDVVKVYDGTHQTPKYQDNGVMFVSVEDIRTLTSKKYISKEDYEKNYSAVPETGDILMTRIGDIGTVNIVRNNLPLAYYVSLALLKNKHMHPEYLKANIMAPAFQNELWLRTLHTAYPKKINKDEIGKCLISVAPTKEEQTAVGKYFEKLDNLIAAQLHMLEEQKKYKEALMKLLLTGIVRVDI